MVADLKQGAGYRALFFSAGSGIQRSSLPKRVGTARSLSGMDKKHQIQDFALIFNSPDKTSREFREVAIPNRTLSR